MPRAIGVLDGEAVISGFIKSPLTTESIAVGIEQIDGDGQADLTVHGGVDKAVYCYPADHWPWWEREKQLPCRPGTFGENLTVEGCDETNLAIGDRFRWGDVLLEVSQPRAPCYKFAICTRRADAPSVMTLSGRTGWYFRVIRAGQAPVRSGDVVREESSGGPSVREAFMAAMDPRIPGETLRRVAEATGLAESWRHAVAKRLAI
jgi:MOSC domain-containing protein YiiM